MSEKIWCLRPRYVREFKCDGTRCGALCCRGDWNIYVDAKTYEKYRTLEGVTQHLLRDPSAERYLLLLDENGTCPMLGADNLCSIQKAHGEDYLSPVCASYPRIITRFENFIELALSPTCPLAAELILLAEEPLTFDVIEADEKLLRLGECHILRGIPQDFAPLIFDVQLVMISILQERRLTLDRRLIVLGFFLDKVEELLYGGRLDGTALEKLAAIYSSESFMTRQVPLMLAGIRFNASAHERFMRQVTAKLYGDPLPFRERIPLAQFATPLENLLVNEIILHIFPWRIDASITKNFGVLVTMCKIFERLLSVRGSRSISDFMRVASDFSRKVDHSDDVILQIAEFLEGDMLTLMETLLRV